MIDVIIFCALIICFAVVKVYTAKDGYELGDNIQSKVLAFAFGLSAEIEREMISRRTKEALAKKKAEGVVLGRPKGRKSGTVKLTGKAHDIKVMLDYGIPKVQIAKKMKVNRNTLSTYINTRYQAELADWEERHGIKKGEKGNEY